MQRLHPADPQKGGISIFIKEFTMSVRKNTIAIALITLAAPAVFAQSASVFVGGKIAHNPKPDAIKTPGERQLFQQQYPA